MTTSDPTVQRCTDLLAQGRVDEVLELERQQPGVLTSAFALSAPEVGDWRISALLESPRPQHWFFPGYQERLVAWYGTRDAGRLWCAMAGLDFQGVRQLPLLPLRDYAAEHGTRFDVVHTGETTVMPRPPVFGRAPEDGLPTRSRDVFVTVLRDAVVSSKGNLVMTSDAALLDATTEELEKAELDLSCEPELLATTWPSARWGEPLDLLVAGSAPVLERAFSLVGVNSYNFGHWHMEVLPKLWALRETSAAGGLPLLVDAQMPPQNFEALRVLVGDDHPLHVLEPGASVTVRELWLCSSTLYVPLAPAWGTVPAPDLLACAPRPFAGFLKELRPRVEAAGTTADLPRRLFLTRQDSQHRRLVNRAEVEDWFVGQGFHVVDFADLSFSQQLQAVNHAEVVVGPDGSSFMATLYADAGTRIGILNNPFLEDNEWYVHVSEALGHKLLWLLGEVVEPDSAYRFRSSYRIDVAALPAYLGALMAL